MRDQSLTTLAGKFRPDVRITVMTGAGVSAASGVPTFRGPGGLWKDFRPELLATTEAFQRDPRLVWEWYDSRRQVLSRTTPNRAHEVLAAWSKRYPNFTLITQNVDGLHERAGTGNVIRFHGSIWEVQCWNECGSSPKRWWDETVPFARIPPECPHCGGLIRPGVVWFGEGLPDTIWEEAVSSTREADLFFVIGTSAVVHPAAGLVYLAKSSGAKVVEINVDDTPVSSTVDLSWRAPAAVALPSLLEQKT